MISTTEALILGLLARTPAGAFGSELLHASEGRLKRGSVYALLGRLEKAKLVKATEEEPTDQYAAPRTRYRITATGVTAYSQFADFVGLQLPKGAVAT